MNTKSLLENFGYIANAPDGVKRLREMILHSAVSGSLVAQIGSDGKAETDVEQAEILRDEFRQRYEIRKKKPIAPLRDEEIPFPIPVNWKWSRLESVACYIQRGKGPKYAETGRARVVSQKCIQWSGFDLTLARRISDESLEKYGEERFLNECDILWNSTGTGTAGRVALYTGSQNPVVADSHVTVIRLTNFISQYVWCYLVSPTIQARMAPNQEGSMVSGTTNQVELSTSKVSELLVPCPPILEQKRIVARVNELMAFCDKLEAKQRERERRFPILSRVIHARFAKSPTPAHLKAIFEETETVSPGDLRKTILTLAVQGKLVPQDPNDDSIEELLLELTGLKSELVADRKIRNQKVSTAPLESDFPFQIPNEWEWVRLGQMVTLIGGYAYKSGEYVSESSNQIIRLGNVKNDSLLIDKKPAFIRDALAQQTSEFRILEGDILVTMTGTKAKRDYAFTLTVKPADLEARRLFLNQRVGAIRPLRHELVPLINVFLKSDQLLDLIFITATGTANQANIGISSILDLPFPLPSLDEQRRIVAKVDQLMALVDQFENQQSKKAKIAEAFAQTAIATITGINQGQGPSAASEGSISMKKKRDSQPRPATLEKPLSISTTNFILHRFAMESGYRSLHDFNCSYHSEIGEPAEASPICLVGLNGSGKSNLIEAIAEVFCYLELINLPWKKVQSSSSRYRKNRHRFELEYMIEDPKGKNIVRIRKTKMGVVDFFMVDDEGAEIPVESGQDQLLLLPRRIIGYSSGLNETISHPFLRTRTMYSEEVRDAAPPIDVKLSESKAVFDTRTLYMDYESNAAILICNYIFRKKSELSVFDKFTRVKGVSSFGLRFSRKIAGKSGTNSTARLTSELASYLERFGRCAGEVCDPEQLTYSFDFHLDQKTKLLFRSEFKTAETLFIAMHKWSLLNALVLSDSQRKVFLKDDITKGTLERPPLVPPTDRIFNIVDVKILLSTPEMQIDYSGLSDGEHQFVQVFGTVLLFNEPGTLFLFDEPESHFNPEWRTKFNLILNGLPNAKCHEYLISTHSPFVISGSRGSNVYKFTRIGANVKCEPIDFETYGASFDFLLKKLFSIDSMIDESARGELEAILKRGDLEEMESAVEDFAESREKRRLYEALIQKETGQE
jgi:type I restriction enzyme, S subunit